eukprot:14626685-Alexandrium_andersonii.AAC.1
MATVKCDWCQQLRVSGKGKGNKKGKKGKNEKSEKPGKGKGGEGKSSQQTPPRLPGNLRALDEA